MAVCNHGINFRGIFSRYFAPHSCNYSVNFIPYKKEKCVVAVASRMVSGWNILPNSARNFLAKNKYSVPRDNVTSSELFALELASSHHVPIEKRSASALLYRLNDTVVGAKCCMRVVKLWETWPAGDSTVCWTRFRKLRGMSRVYADRERLAIIIYCKSIYGIFSDIFLRYILIVSVLQFLWQKFDSRLSFTAKFKFSILSYI